jgi:uncharacterized C2H2 Zn-finger protein
MSNDLTKKIQIPGDRDGFITLQCPYCNEIFKLTISFLEKEYVIDLYCPCCGLKHDSNQFLMTRQDVKEQIEIEIGNLVADVINQFSKNLERNIQSKNVKFTAGKPISLQTGNLLYEKDELEIMSLRCCNILVKAKDLQKEIGLYCPQCGVK